MRFGPNDVHRAIIASTAVIRVVQQPSILEHKTHYHPVKWNTKGSDRIDRVRRGRIHLRPVSAQPRTQLLTRIYLSLHVKKNPSQTQHLSPCHTLRLNIEYSIWQTANDESHAIFPFFPTHRTLMFHAHWLMRSQPYTFGHSHRIPYTLRIFVEKNDGSYWH